MTGTEDESDFSRTRRRVKENIKKEAVKPIESTVIYDPLTSIPKSKLLRAKSKINEVQKLLVAFSKTSRRVNSQSKEIAYYRLSMACAILNCIDDPSTGKVKIERIPEEINRVNIKASF